MEIEIARERVVRALRSRYGIDPAGARLVFAPYRICPLGAHIDHQLGPVTAMAIDRGVLLAFAPTTTGEVRLTSLDYPGEVQFDLRLAIPPATHDWGDFARGAVRALVQAGHRVSAGMVGVIAGPWSEGGLSSSAAVGIAYLMALEDVNHLTVIPEENIRLDQFIENDYLGLRNGILDQSGIILSRRDHLTVIDCATAQHQVIPAAAKSTGLMLVFSGLRQALVTTNYNRRVEECAEAARILLEATGRSDSAPLLRNVPLQAYLDHRTRLPAPLDRRAAHFFSETERVRQGVAAWMQGDLVAFGRLMTASGESSIHNYECGSPPLIDLHRLLIRCDGVYGARFSGAGFRGCCIALVDSAKAREIAEEVQHRYAEVQPELALRAFVEACRSGDGARRW